MATKRANTPAEPAEQSKKFVVAFNADNLPTWTGREIRDFERVQPVKFVNLVRVMQSGEMPWDTLLALFWILHRRTDPTFTFDDMLDLPTDAWELEGVRVVDDENPTPEPVAMPTGS